MLRDVATRFADREALVSLHEDRRLTYRQLWTEAGRLAKGLLALGIARGDRVGIWATDNVPWVQLQVATARIGAVLVNINPANRQAELRYNLSAAGVKVLVYEERFKSSDYAAMVAALEPEDAPELKHTVSYGEIEPVCRRGDLIDDATLTEREDSLDPDDPINIQFTSGTTGFPKPVVLTHHNILNNAYTTGEVLGVTENDRLCVPLPFYHCFGMVVSNLLCLSRGAAIVIPAPHFDAHATLSAIQSERCTILHGVPTMFVAELEDPEFAKYDLASLRTGIMAGAPCPPELMRRVREVMGLEDIRIGYGQTEASPVTHITRAGDSEDLMIHTVGTSMPHQECKIADPETHARVPLGERGEICVRGPMVMREYYGRPADTREAIDEAGWLHTGDLGAMDKNGYVRITGRLKNMIIRGGENLYPAEIEAMLSEHEAIAQVAVFGVPHERWGEQTVAWVQVHEGATLDPEELREWAKQRMAHFKVPDIVRLVTEFPMTVTGKIQKFRMREIEEERDRP
jgi:fatty-acyl-CoA synthase